MVLSWNLNPACRSLLGYSLGEAANAVVRVRGLGPLDAIFVCDPDTRMKNMAVEGSRSTGAGLARASNE